MGTWLGFLRDRTSCWGRLCVRPLCPPHSGCWPCSSLCSASLLLDRALTLPFLETRTACGGGAQAGDRPGPPRNKGEIPRIPGTCSADTETLGSRIPRGWGDGRWAGTGGRHSDHAPASFPIDASRMRDQSPEEAPEQGPGLELPFVKRLLSSYSSLPRSQAPISGNRAWGWGALRVFLSPCAGRGWAPCSGGVSGTVTQQWVRAQGFPWLTHSPRPACASAQAGAVCEGVAHSEGVPGTRGAGAEQPRAAGGRFAHGALRPPRTPAPSFLPYPSTSPSSTGLPLSNTRGALRPQGS